MGLVLDGEAPRRWSEVFWPRNVSPLSIRAACTPAFFFAAYARLIASRCALPGRFFGCCPCVVFAAFYAGVCPTRGS
ncbi:hypothetical protein GCM10010260_84010 [Streptomyces filipinensis]|uniref:Uncharacterized protein n=1 Tax=Streptomyces filipinensis TaxID=66887 RepID=A0A918IKI7_9ACTN|nr:hypothetical protein [Streptomyces filipinensis]GGV30820.1 hypothetical protein GCM10010260_84010 [Streptomyces filipinensis]